MDGWKKGRVDGWMGGRREGKKGGRMEQAVEHCLLQNPFPTKNIHDRCNFCISPMNTFIGVIRKRGQAGQVRAESGLDKFVYLVRAIKS